MTSVLVANDTMIAACTLINQCTSLVGIYMKAKKLANYCEHGCEELEADYPVDVGIRAEHEL